MNVLALFNILVGRIPLDMLEVTLVIMLPHLLLPERTDLATEV